jgi:type II protein arginine methyltransferase
VRMQVSELLGSFGDNELAPECLAEVGALLRPGGISIPASYTSFLAPVCTHAVHATIRGMAKHARFEVGMVVRLWKHVVLAAAERVFSFAHPGRCANQP